jgi:ABC-2 type transport system ATP-binding protein
MGQATVEAEPADPDDVERTRSVLARFGEPAAAAKGCGVQLRGGPDQLAEIVRALDGEGIRIANLQLHAPSLDDVFLAKTGRSLEGAASEDEDAEPVPV